MPADTAPPPDKPTLEAPAPQDKPPSDFMSDIMGDFASMDSGTPPAEKSKAPKPDETKPPKPETKPPAGETKKPETATKPDKDETPEPAPKPVKAAELRTAYEGLKKKVREEYEPELQRLRAKVQETEARKPEEETALLSKIKSLEGANSELEKRLERLAYKESSKFLKEHEEPYARAWDEAVRQLQRLTVRERSGEDEMGEPIYKTRTGTEADLIRLGQMSDSELDVAVQEMFGASSARVVNHLQKLHSLHDARREALANAEKLAQEEKQRGQATDAERTSRLASTWTEINKSLRERFPKAFEPDAGNEDDKAAFNKGFAYADLMFGDETKLTPEQIESLPESFRQTLKAKQPLSETQRVHLHALVRLRIANHDRQVVRLKKAQDRIKELEKELSEYEKSEPGTGKAGESSGRSGGKDWLETAEDELRALDK